MQILCQSVLKNAGKTIQVNVIVIALKVICFVNSDTQFKITYIKIDSKMNCNLKPIVSDGI